MGVTRDGKPVASGWRESAAASGGLVPDPSPVLTASEIGAFVFCRQAWFLQRCGVSVSPETEVRLAAGSSVHQAIGRRADLVQAAGVGRRLALAAIVVLALLLLLVAVRGVP